MVLRNESCGCLKDGMLCIIHTKPLSLPGWTLGHCSVPLVFCHLAQMLLVFPGDFAKLCSAQFCLCENIANFFFFFS